MFLNENYNLDVLIYIPFFIVIQLIYTLFALLTHSAFYSLHRLLQMNASYRKGLLNVQTLMCLYFGLLQFKQVSLLKM